MDKGKGYALLDTHIKHEIRQSHHRIIKDVLRILEDIRDNRYAISEETFSFLRKKVLDNINDESRHLEESFDLDKIIKLVLIVANHENSGN